jgi:hypothetical protein
MQKKKCPRKSHAWAPLSSPSETRRFNFLDPIYNLMSVKTVPLNVHLKRKIQFLTHTTKSEKL